MDAPKKKMLWDEAFFKRRALRLSPFMVSVLTGTNPALSQGPIIEQLLYFYDASRYSAAAITFCLEMKAADEKNWAIVKKKNGVKRGIRWES